MSLEIGTLWATLALRDSMSDAVKAAFQNYKDAADSTDLSSRNFATSLTNVTKLANDFSGINLDAKAQQYAAAIEQVGGASVLTADEMQRVNDVMTDAIAKYAALGQTAPANVLALRDATNDASNATGPDGLMGIVEQVGAVVAAAFTVQQIISFSEQVMATGLSLEFTSSQLGVSTQFAQQMGYALQQSGGSADSMNASLTIMARNIQDNTPKAATAIKDLGLSIDDIKTMSPEAAFLAIANAIEAVPSPLQQLADAMDIFGRGARNILPAIKADIQAVGDQAPLMSDETTAALANMQRAWLTFKAEGLETAATALVTVHDNLWIVEDALATMAIVALPQLITAVETATTALLAMLANPVVAAAVAMAAALIALKEAYVGLSVPAADAVANAKALSAAQNQATIDTVNLQVALGYITKAQGDAQLASYGLGSTVKDTAKALHDLESKTAAVVAQFNTFSDSEKQRIIDDIAHQNSVNELAAALGVMPAAIQMIVDENTKHIASMKAEQESAAAYQKALDDLGSIGKTWTDTLAGMDQFQVQLILSTGMAKLSYDDLNLVLGASKTQAALTHVEYDALRQSMNAVATDAKTVADAIKASTSDTAKLVADFADQEMKLSGTTTDVKLANIDLVTQREQIAYATRTANARVAIAQAEALGQDMSQARRDLETADAAFAVALANDTAAKKITAIVNVAQLEQINQADTQHGLQQIADAAMATYQQAVKNFGGYTNTVTDNLLQIALAAQDTADRFTGAFTTAATSSTAAVSSASAAMITKIAAVKDELQQVSDVFKGLAGGTVSSQYLLDPTSATPLDQQAQAKGGTLAYDNFGEAYAYIAGVNAAPQQGAGPGKLVMPSFDVGGPILKDGPIYAHRGEYVVPVGGALMSGSGGNVTIAPGAVTMQIQYPIMNDRAAIQQLTDLVGTGLINRLKALGLKFQS